MRFLMRQLVSLEGYIRYAAPQHTQHPLMRRLRALIMRAAR